MHWTRGSIYWLAAWNRDGIDCWAKCIIGLAINEWLGLWINEIFMASTIYACFDRLGRWTVPCTRHSFSRRPAAPRTMRRSASADCEHYRSNCSGQSLSQMHSMHLIGLVAAFCCTADVSKCRLWCNSDWWMQRLITTTILTYPPLHWFHWCCSAVVVKSRILDVDAWW